MSLKSLLGMFGLLTSWLWAEPAAELQQLYRRRDLAAAQEQVLRLTKDCHPDFVFVSSRGVQLNLSQWRKDLQHEWDRTESQRPQTILLGLQVEGSRASALIRRQGPFESSSWSLGKPPSGTLEEVCQDDWLKGPRGWQLLSSITLEQKLKRGKHQQVESVGWVRVVRQFGKPRQMQTSVVTFAAPSGQRVDLISAVHLAEPQYFQELNRRFRSYEGVLYELIAPRDDGQGRVIPLPSDSADNPLSATQLYLSKLLGLSFQLQGVDYTSKNFVHADLSPDELLHSMKLRGESPQTLVAQLIRESLKHSSAIDPVDAVTLDYALASILLRGPTTSDRYLLRRALAASFTDLEKLTAGLGGPQGSVLLVGRNQQAIQVLKRELARGRRRLAIFYGAAHMPDLEQRLLSLGMRRQRVQFITAWSLQPPTP